DHDNVVDQRMMVDPDNPDREETNQVADEYGPTVAQLLQQGPMAWPLDAEIERQQGDGDSKDAVTKRFEPSPGHLLTGGGGCRHRVQVGFHPLLLRVITIHPLTRPVSE